MPRTRGAQDADYPEKRIALLQKLTAFLLDSGPEKISFSEMAVAAEVSIPTLRHYFSNRSGVILSVLDHLNQVGQRYIEQVASTELPFAQSMEEAGEALLAGYLFGRVERIHRLGLTEGMVEPDLGPAYLNSILEPALQAFEKRLSKHIARGEMIDVPVRHASLAFIAPSLLGALHQKLLGGGTVRPMDLRAFTRDHVRSFIRAYQRGV